MATRLWSPLVDYIDESPRSDPRREKIRGLQDHHGATTNLRPMIHGEREVSAHYFILNDGTIIGVVPETRRPYTSGSAADHWMITWEVENAALGDASGWPRSPAATASVIKLAADVAAFYGFAVIRRETYFGHRELWSLLGLSYTTACPGGAPLDDTADAVNSLLAGETLAVSKTFQEEIMSMRFVRAVETGAVYLITDQGHVHVKTPGDFGVLQSIAKAEPGSVTDLAFGQCMTAFSYIHAAQSGDRARHEAELAALGRVKSVDEGVLVEAVKGALVGVQVDAAQIAAEAARLAAELVAKMNAPEVEPTPAARSHVVVPGDTLYSVAKAYGTSVEALRGANDGVDPLPVGKTLTVPGA